MKDARSRRFADAPGADSPGATSPDAGLSPGDGADAPASSRSLTVRDRRAAEALVDPTTLRHLAPFLGRDRSVAEAARETGEKPNTTLRRVRRFVAMGLLRVWREVPRAGRPVKRYRAVADVFFVPFDATGAESLEAALAERDAYWERLLRRNVVRGRMEALGTWGTRVYRDARGRLQVQTAVRPDVNATTLDPGAPAVLSLWRDALMLDFEDAKALQREMFALMQRYQQRTGAQRYVVRMGLAPVLTEEA
jgi:hypothetical protein